MKMLAPGFLRVLGALLVVWLTASPPATAFAWAHGAHVGADQLEAHLHSHAPGLTDHHVTVAAPDCDCGDSIARVMPGSTLEPPNDAGRIASEISDVAVDAHLDATFEALPRLTHLSGRDTSPSTPPPRWFS